MATPKLRFKEFDGDWSNKKIGNIASKVGSGSTPRGGAEAYTDHGIIFIRSQNVNNDQLLLDDVAYIPEETHVKMSGSKVIANDILLNITGASIGRSCVVPHDFTEANVNQHVCIIRTPNDDPIFVQSFLSSENGQNAIQSKQAGGGREGLNFQAIRSIDFHFPPSKAEQTKIASFLSAVDEKISQLTQKHALLSQYKQGMMQKLFSQKIRFKADDGNDFGEWEEVRLGNLVDLTSGFAFKSDFFSEDGNKLITPKNFTTTGKANFTDTNTKWTTEISDKKYICRPNDLLVLLTDLTQSCELLGKPILLSQDDGNVLLNQRIVKIIPNRKLEKPFLLYLLLTDDFHELIVSTASGTTVKHSSNKVLQNFHFYLPCLEEQTKIANFLSAIDQKIEVVVQQIEQAKQWKKGLLQQMFV